MKKIFLVIEVPDEVNLPMIRGSMCRMSGVKSAKTYDADDNLGPLLENISATHCLACGDRTGGKSCTCRRDE